MTSRGNRSIPKVDYNTLNSVGFDTSGSSMPEESSASGSEVHDVQVDVNRGDDDVDSELLLLQSAVAKKEAERQKLVEEEKKRLRAQLDRSTKEVDELKAKRKKKGSSNSSSDITINSLRSDKKLKKKVASKLKELALKDSSDSEYDTACSDASFTSDSESDSNSDFSCSSKKSHSAKKKKHKKSKSKKSELCLKLLTRSNILKKWPQAYLQYEYANKSVSFTDLSFSLLVAGELEIIADCRSSAERKGRTTLL